MDIKIRNDGRRRKRESNKVAQLYNCLTPPKYTSKKSVYNTVAKWEKKFGYNYESPEDELNPYLRQMRQQFQDKAVKYCGGDYFAKKTTRFDKMKMKQQTGFKLEEMPIKRKFKRADQIVTCLLKKQALYALLKVR